MRLIRTLIPGAALLLFVTSALGQAAENKHFAKDGLSFDYPANWQLTDRSTAQMQFIQLLRDDLEIRIRAPREWLKTPEKEAQAKKIFQDQYVDNFATQVEQAGMHPKRSVVTTQIAGADAQGARI